MPTNPSPTGRGETAATVLQLFVRLHSQVRLEIMDLDGDALNWVPMAKTNSIATVITHLLGSEAETLRTVAGVADTRSRESEFTGLRQTPEQVLAGLNAADGLVAEFESVIDSDRLRAVLALPTLTPEERHSGLWWLVGNYGHAREHVGHIQLT